MLRTCFLVILALVGSCALQCRAAQTSTPSFEDTIRPILKTRCFACHGEGGLGANPAWPKLAAQKPGYLVNVLKAFKAGLRKDPMMAGVARGLSDTNMADLAAYYAAQSCQPAK